MQKSQRFALIGAAAVALAAVFMVKFYLDQQRQMIADEERKRVEVFKEQIQVNQTDQVSILTAKKDIPYGGIIEVDSVEVKTFPSQAVQPNSISSIDRVAGLIAIAPIAKGEQILANKLSSRREAALDSSSLAMATPSGKRAITIPIDNISSLAGMIKPGDYVDIIVMVPLPVQGADGKPAVQPASMPVFQNILILAIGQEIGTFVKKGEDSRYKKEQKAADSQATASASPLVTLALTPQETNLMSFIQEQGKVRLVLRSPADSQVVQPQPANWDAVLRSMMPPAPKGATAEMKMPEADKKPIVEKEATGPVKTVEIYRGTEKKVVNLSK